MLCSSIDLSKKNIPADMKSIETQADHIYRDLTIVFSMFSFRKSLLNIATSLSQDLPYKDKSHSFNIGEKVSLEGVQLLPCMYLEPPTVAKSS